MTNKYFLGIAAAASLAMFSQVTAAGGFNYTYADAGYRNVDSDNYSGDGLQVGLSYGATDYMHIVGTYSRLWVDDIDGASDVDVDIDEFTIGFGGHYSITDKIDLAGELVYVDDEYTGDARPDNLGYKTNINESEEGYQATVYGRIQALKNLEMTPHIVYRDVEDSETGFGLGLVYDLTKKFAIRARATSFNGDNDTTNLFLGLRLYM
jgi:hypothetical protein